jgi:uncharacterized tellurite resistance protein B-like protein
MANAALIPALAKTLIAIAWADGEIHREEEATLKEILGLLPAISAQEWTVIEMYLAVPVTEDERIELAQNTCNLIRRSVDKQVALDAVDRMLHADARVEPAEEAVAEAVREAFAAVNVSPLAALGRALGGLVHQKPQREAEFELWRDNPVVYVLRSRLPGDASLEQPAIETAALAACIMAQVAHTTADGIEAERQAMVDALGDDWDLNQVQAAQVAETALALAQRHLDYYRINRGLIDRTTEAQRLRLLDSLFTVANAADRVALAEIDAIGVIAGRLNLSRQQFVAAKLKIPSADRGGF